MPIVNRMFECRTFVDQEASANPSGLRGAARQGLAFGEGFDGETVPGTRFPRQVPSIFAPIPFPPLLSSLRSRPSAPLCAKTGSEFEPWSTCFLLWRLWVLIIAGLRLRTLMLKDTTLRFLYLMGQQGNGWQQRKKLV
ncbi:hypothetical protein E2542_SST05506 [Spatholobus suberectus]|nr:hypothetical protein E2542_SST05506 [Spatholobus suberectus]